MAACYTPLSQVHRGGYMRAHAQWTRDIDQSNGGRSLQSRPNTIMTAIL